MDEVQAFYEGFVLAANSLEADERLDHMDFMVAEDDLPEGASIKGLMDYLMATDDGNIIEVFLVKKQAWEDYGDGESGPMVRAWEYVVLRIVDLQAGPDYMMRDARIAELHKGEVDGTAA